VCLIVVVSVISVVWSLLFVCVVVCLFCFFFFFFVIVYHQEEKRRVELVHCFNVTYPYHGGTTGLLEELTFMLLSRPFYRLLKSVYYSKKISMHSIISPSVVAELKRKT
jgi:hypothetical protein